MSLVAGVDISGGAAHVVILEGGQVAEAIVWPTDDLIHLAEALMTCGVVAIDSPDRWSHGAIPEHEGLSPKFVAVRCAEFELARRYRYWVPWVTPRPPRSDLERAKYAWMARGMELFQLLEGRAETIEVYPHAIFRQLAKQAPLPSKSRQAGGRMRVALLHEAGITTPHLEMWSHDGLDAAAAAVAALARAREEAERVSCDHDGSAMWLPASLR